LRLGDTFARFGGDEFAMLLEDLEDVGPAADVAERIKRDLSAPFEVDGHEAVVTTSIGIVMAAPGEDRRGLRRGAHEKGGHRHVPEQERGQGPPRVFSS
jgi:GGDEF domain-containing protein